MDTRNVIKLKILFAVSDEVEKHLLSRLLLNHNLSTNLKVEIEYAETGNSALAQYKSANGHSKESKATPFDLVILSHRIVFRPGNDKRRNGVDTLLEIRRHIPLAKIVMAAKNSDVLNNVKWCRAGDPLYHDVNIKKIGCLSRPYSAHQIKQMLKMYCSFKISNMLEFPSFVSNDALCAGSSINTPQELFHSESDDNTATSNDDQMLSTKPEIELPAINLFSTAPILSRSAPKQPVSILPDVRLPLLQLDALIASPTVTACASSVRSVLSLSTPSQYNDRDSARPKPKRYVAPLHFDNFSNLFAEKTEALAPTQDPLDKKNDLTLKR